ncbi:MAG: S-layer homology domain-containing protein [Acidimicrobiales bacterium]|nr:S-layer homology domain-containing protein [Acidimicrobiales bacterium]
MARKGHGGRVVAALIVLVAVSAAIASVTRMDGPRPGCAPGQVPVATVGGVALCTHGPDTSGSLGAAGEPAEAGTPRAVACIGNGTSGARVQAVYARASGRADRYAVLLPELRAAAADVAHLVNRSAAQTGGERHVRWQTTKRAVDPTCQVDVARATVPADAATDFGGLVDSLAAQGFDRHDRKYVVWLDTATTTCSGIATHLDDDRRGQDNFNNTSVGYARVDDSCLDHGGVAETHELLHLLGAVQGSAPHASPEGHCTDEHDLLCYDEDGSGPFRTAVRCPSSSLERRLDCHDDDYFSTDPAPGSYLATHWNAADSRFLDDEAPVVVPSPTDDPPANDAFAGAPVLSGYAGATPGTVAGATFEEGEAPAASGIAGSVWYKWRPRVDAQVSVDTRGTAGDTVLAVFTGASVDALTPVGANDDALDLAPQSRVTFTAVAGTTYRIAVAGRGATTSVNLRWGPPPHGFTDALPGARVETAVGWSAAFGVMPGWPDRTWRPRLTMTRSKAVATLWRLMGAPPAADPEPPPPTTTTTAPAPTTTTAAPATTTTVGPTTSTSTTVVTTTTSTTAPANPSLGEAGTPLPFTDVGPAAPYRAALEWAVAEGVVPAARTFRPTDPLTRGDLAAWTWAAAGRPGATEVAAFTDLAGSSPYRPAAAWATEHDLLAGYGDGTFRPTATITRSKLALGLFALAQDPAAWPTGEAPPTVVF